MIKHSIGIELLRPPRICGNEKEEKKPKCITEFELRQRNPLDSRL